MHVGPGTKIAARVESVQPFGAFLYGPFGRALLHWPLMSWVMPFTPSVHFTAGDELEVVCAKRDEDGFFVSLRDATPWSQRANLKTGDAVSGHVREFNQEHFIVEIEKGIVVDFHVADAP